jgi:2-keto-myo-inositol isomerase
LGNQFLDIVGKRRGQTMERWKLGLNGANTMNCGLAEEILIAGQLGYDYLEIRDWKLEAFLKEGSVDDLPGLFSKAGVKPLALDSIEPVTIGSKADRGRLVESAEWHLRMAGAIGCECVTASGYGAPEGLSESEGWRQVVEGVELVSDIAAKYNVPVAYEFLCSPGTPVHTIAGTMELLDQMNRDNVGWLLDFYHFHVADPSLESLAKADASRLLLVHINDVKNLPYERLVSLDQRLFPGDGLSDTAGILRTLYQTGYRGPFSVELFNSEFLSWDPVDFAKVAKEKTEAVLGKYFC